MTHSSFGLPVVAAALILVGGTGCSATQLPALVKALDAKSPEALSKILVDEDRGVADVCSTMRHRSADASANPKISKLLDREQRRNLSAMLGALRPDGDAASTQDCRPARWSTEALEKCITEIQTAYVAAKDSAGELRDVAQGLRHALGALDALTTADAPLVAAKMQFSIVAVDAYIRFVSALEGEIDRLLAQIQIPLPWVGELASSLVRAAAREATAELLAVGLDKVVLTLQEHHLVHRPAMLRQACNRYEQNPQLGLMVSRGLKRVILSALPGAASLTDRKCALLSVRTDGADGTSETTPFCPAIGSESTLERVTTQPPSNELARTEGSIPVLADAEPHRETEANTRLDAQVVKVAAIACARLQKPGAGQSLRQCDTPTFNLLGSLVSTDRSSTPDRANDVVATTVLSRLDHVDRVQREIVHSLADTNSSLTSLADTVSLQLSGIQQRLDDISLLESAQLADSKKCKAAEEKVRAARVAFARLLGTDFDSICASGAEKTTPVKIGTIVLRFHRGEFCAMQQPASIALWFPDGLFAPGRAEPNLRKLGDMKSSLPSELFASELDVIGHVDPTGFMDRVMSYQRGQQNLMKARADSVVAWAAAQNGPTSSIKWHAQVGKVPIEGNCASQTECAQWRTVSFQFPKLLPHVNSADCSVTGGK